MIAPLPGARVEVVGWLVGRLSDNVVVTACLGGESWLAVCPASGRIGAIMHPTDMLDVQLAGISFRVPAGMTALRSAPPDLTMVGFPAGRGKPVAVDGLTLAAPAPAPLRGLDSAATTYTPDHPHMASVETVDTRSLGRLPAAASTLKPIVQREPWRHDRR